MTILLGLAGCAAPPYPGIVNFNKPVFSSGLVASCGRQPLCRLGPLHILLMRSNGSVVSRTIDQPLPYIAGDYVTIYAGERLYLQAQLVGEGVKPESVVPFIADPSHTLLLQLRQPAYMNTGLYRGPGGMVLTVYNPFSNPLVYKAAIMPADSHKPETVSTCAVMPGTSNYEVWRVPVLLVWLTDLHLISNIDAIPCH